jgi:hypothetical protein
MEAETEEDKIWAANQAARQAEVSFEVSFGKEADMGTQHWTVKRALCRLAESEDEERDAAGEGPPQAHAAGSSYWGATTQLAPSNSTWGQPTASGRRRLDRQNRQNESNETRPRQRVVFSPTSES